MRHVVGFLFGVLLGPLLALLTGWAFVHLRQVHLQDASVLAGVGPGALAALAVVGLLVAVVAVPARLTPMLAFGAALGLGALTALSLVRMHLLVRLPGLPGTEGALELLPLGVFVPVVLVLLAPLFVGRRWVRRDQDEVSQDYFDGLQEQEPAPSGPKHRY